MREELWDLKLHLPGFIIPSRALQIQGRGSGTLRSQGEVDMTFWEVVDEHVVTYSRLTWPAWVIQCSAAINKLTVCHNKLTKICTYFYKLPQGCLGRTWHLQVVNDSTHDFPSTPLKLEVEPSSGLLSDTRKKMESGRCRKSAFSTAQLPACNLFLKGKPKRFFQISVFLKEIAEAVMLTLNPRKGKT